MDFLAKIFKRGGPRIPKAVKQSLSKHFSKAKSIEWGNHGELYEALFFDQDIEKIARFDQNGKLVECRINTPVPEIPYFVKTNLEEDFEIMNCIAVYASETMNYELIVRNHELTRYHLLIDSLGHKIKMERL
ncbi:MAG: hypothetical protein IH598_12010 [Bacteroidales bacterium]|nr:hypothetical protein [Bacteroidales bacterium]